MADVSGGDILFHLRLNSSQYEAGLQAADTRLRTFATYQTSLYGNLRNSLNAASDGVWNFARTVAAGGVISAAGLWRVTASFEQTAVAIEGMIGSGKRAREFMEGLKDFAARTPFTFWGIARASRMLMAMGFAAKEVMPALTAMGEAISARASGEDINALLERTAYNIGQIKAAGKLRGYEVRDLATAGIPVYKYLAEGLGLSGPNAQGQAMDIAQKGGIPAELALKSLFAGMKRDFSGMMDKQFKTMLGQWSNVMDRLTYAAVDFGLAIRPVFEKVISIIQGVTNWLANLSEGQKRSLANLALFGTIGAVAISALLRITSGVMSAAAAYKFLSTNINLAAMSQANFAAQATAYQNPAAWMRWPGSSYTAGQRSPAVSQLFRPSLAGGYGMPQVPGRFSPAYTPGGTSGPRDFASGGPMLVRLASEAHGAPIRPGWEYPPLPPGGGTPPAPFRGVPLRPSGPRFLPSSGGGNFVRRGHEILDRLGVADLAPTGLKSIIGAGGLRVEMEDLSYLGIGGDYRPLEPGGYFSPGRIRLDQFSHTRYLGASRSTFLHESGHALSDFMSYIPYGTPVRQTYSDTVIQQALLAREDAWRKSNSSPYPTIRRARQRGWQKAEFAYYQNLVGRTRAPGYAVHRNWEPWTRAQAFTEWEDAAFHPTIASNAFALLRGGRRLDPNSGVGFSSIQQEAQLRRARQSPMLRPFLYDRADNINYGAGDEAFADLVSYSGMRTSGVQPFAPVWDRIAGMRSWTPRGLSTLAPLYGGSGYYPSPEANMLAQSAQESLIMRPAMMNNRLRYMQRFLPRFIPSSGGARPATVLPQTMGGRLLAAGLGVTMLGASGLGLGTAGRDFAQRVAMRQRMENMRVIYDRQQQRELQRIRSMPRGPRFMRSEGGGGTVFSSGYGADFPAWANLGSQTHPEGIRNMLLALEQQRNKAVSSGSGWQWEESPRFTWNRQNYPMHTTAGSGVMEALRPYGTPVSLPVPPTYDYTPDYQANQGVISAPLYSGYGMSSLFGLANRGRVESPNLHSTTFPEYASFYAAGGPVMKAWNHPTGYLDRLDDHFGGFTRSHGLMYQFGAERRPDNYVGHPGTWGGLDEAYFRDMSIWQANLQRVIAVDRTAARTKQGLPFELPTGNPSRLQNVRRASSIHGLDITPFAFALMGGMPMPLPITSAYEEARIAGYRELMAYRQQRKQGGHAFMPSAGGGSGAPFGNVFGAAHRQQFGASATGISPALLQLLEQGYIQQHSIYHAPLETQAEMKAGNVYGATWTEDPLQSFIGLHPGGPGGTALMRTTRHHEATHQLYPMMEKAHLLDVSGTVAQRGQSLFAALNTNPALRGIATKVRAAYGSIMSGSGEGIYSILERMQVPARQTPGHTALTTLASQSGLLGAAGGNINNAMMAMMMGYASQKGRTGIEGLLAAAGPGNAEEIMAHMAATGFAVDPTKADVLFRGAATNMRKYAPTSGLMRYAHVESGGFMQSPEFAALGKTAAARRAYRARLLGDVVPRLRAGAMLYGADPLAGGAPGQYAILAAMRAEAVAGGGGINMVPGSKGAPWPNTYQGELVPHPGGGYYPPQVPPRGPARPEGGWPIMPYGQQMGGRRGGGMGSHLGMMAAWTLGPMALMAGGSLVASQFGKLMEENAAFRESTLKTFKALSDAATTFGRGVASVVKASWGIVDVAGRVAGFSLKVGGKVAEFATTNPFGQTLTTTVLAGMAAGKVGGLLGRAGAAWGAVGKGAGLMGYLRGGMIPIAEGVGAGLSGAASNVGGFARGFLGRLIGRAAVGTAATTAGTGIFSASAGGAASMIAGGGAAALGATLAPVIIATTALAGAFFALKWQVDKDRAAMSDYNKELDHARLKLQEAETERDRVRDVVADFDDRFTPMQSRYTNLYNTKNRTPEQEQGLAFGRTAILREMQQMSVQMNLPATNWDGSIAGMEAFKKSVDAAKKSMEAFAETARLMTKVSESVVAGSKLMQSQGSASYFGTNLNQVAAGSGSASPWAMIGNAAYTAAGIGWGYAGYLAGGGKEVYQQEQYNTWYNTYAALRMQQERTATLNPNPVAMFQRKDQLGRTVDAEGRPVSVSGKPAALDTAAFDYVAAAVEQMRVKDPALFNAMNAQYQSQTALYRTTTTLPPLKAEELPEGRLLRAEYGNKFAILQQQRDTLKSQIAKEANIDTRRKLQGDLDDITAEIGDTTRSIDEAAGTMLGQMLQVELDRVLKMTAIPQDQPGGGEEIKVEAEIALNKLKTALEITKLKNGAATAAALKDIQRNEDLVKSYLSIATDYRATLSGSARALNVALSGMLLNQPELVSQLLPQQTALIGTAIDLQRAPVPATITDIASLDKYVNTLHGIATKQSGVAGGLANIAGAAGFSGITNTIQKAMEPGGGGVSVIQNYARQLITEDKARLVFAMEAEQTKADAAENIRNEQLEASKDVDAAQKAVHEAEIQRITETRDARLAYIDAYLTATLAAIDQIRKAEDAGRTASRTWEDVGITSGFSRQSFLTGTYTKTMGAIGGMVGGARGSLFGAPGDLLMLQLEQQQATAKAKVATNRTIEDILTAESRRTGKTPADIMAEYQAAAANPATLLQSITAGTAPPVFSEIFDAYAKLVGDLDQLRMDYEQKGLDVKLNIAKDSFEAWKQGVMSDLGSGSLFDNAMLRRGAETVLALTRPMIGLTATGTATQGGTYDYKNPSLYPGTSGTPNTFTADPNMVPIYSPMGTIAGWKQNVNVGGNKFSRTTMTASQASLASLPWAPKTGALNQKTFDAMGSAVPLSPGDFGPGHLNLSTLQEAAAQGLVIIPEMLRKVVPYTGGGSYTYPTLYDMEQLQRYGLLNAATISWFSARAQQGQLMDSTGKKVGAIPADLTTVSPGVGKFTMPSYALPSGYSYSKPTNAPASTVTPGTAIAPIGGTTGASSLPSISDIKYFEKAPPGAQDILSGKYTQGDVTSWFSGLANTLGILGPAASTAQQFGGLVSTGAALDLGKVPSLIPPSLVSGPPLGGVLGSAMAGMPLVGTPTAATANMLAMQALPVDLTLHIQHDGSLKVTAGAMRNVARAVILEELQTMRANGGGLLAGK